MLAMRLFGMLFIVFAIAFIVTQVLIPILMGTKLFPVFRKSTLAIQGQLAEVREQLNEQALKDELAKLKAQLHTDALNVSASVEPVVKADAAKEVK